VAPLLPIKRNRERESKERESVASAVEKPREKVKGCSLAAIAAAASATRELRVEFE